MRIDKKFFKHIVFAKYRMFNGLNNISKNFILLLDQYRHMSAIAKRGSEGLHIGKLTIDAESPTFIIAEIGNNHNGSLELAKKLIEQAATVGADCAKFQMRSFPSFYHNNGNINDPGKDISYHYTLNLLSQFQLSTEEMFTCFDYCKEQGIIPLCSCWDLESLEILERYGIQAYKVASADLTNHCLLRAIVKTGKPLICSTGMSTEGEIIEAVRLLQQLESRYVLLHCNSTYPTPFKDVNLNYLGRLKEIGDCTVGYSGHERGINVVIAAVAKGAKVIEKHLTLDNSMEGNDHRISLLPEEFKTMVKGIRQVEESLGTATERRVSQGELINRETLAKSLAINCNLEPGMIIVEEMIQVKSPGQGLQPNHKAKLIGIKSKRYLKAGDLFFPSDLAQDQVQPRHYRFKRPWGVPVRYHDFKTFLRKSNPDLLEFHLTYNDLEQDIHQYFDQLYDLDLVVHCPEMFCKDHILDLCSQDRDYRQRSIQELQRVINITRSLKLFFKKASRPYIITNIGGFTFEGFLPKSKRDELYELLLNSLSALDQSDVEIILQNMPPFPWHFGGQRFHNLFVVPDEIVAFCSQNDYRVCLDISHSKLACNHHKLSLKEFIKKVGAYAAHLHIADARGVDGEGLQIGDGNVNFLALAKDLEKVAPKVTFIPEVWQGHKNKGEGFWISLERLEQWF